MICFIFSQEESSARWSKVPERDLRCWDAKLSKSPSVRQKQGTIYTGAHNRDLRCWDAKLSKNPAIRQKNHFFRQNKGFAQLGTIEKQRPVMLGYKIAKKILPLDKNKLLRRPLHSLLYINPSCIIENIFIFLTGMPRGEQGELLVPAHGGQHTTEETICHCYLPIWILHMHIAQCKTIVAKCLFASYCKN